MLIVSDFWESPESIVRTIEPLRYHGNEVVLFHVLDPEDVRPQLKGPTIVVDIETKPNSKSRPITARRNIATKSARISKTCAIACRAPAWATSCS